MAEGAEHLAGNVQLYCGDCLDVLKALPENSIDACVTDPPYHLTSIVKRFGADNAAPVKSNGATGVYTRASSGFMGKQWDGGDIAFRPDVWREVLRVLKPGAHLLAFGGTRTYHRMACAIEDAGFEIRDCIQWLYGSGFPKSHNIGNGRGTALKPACELIVLARKPLSEGTIAANVLKHGTGALNIDKSRVEVTGQRPYAVAWENDQILCDSCAALAGNNEKPLTPETRASIATKPVAPITNGKDDHSQVDIVKTDIGCCDGMRADDTSTSSNTERFGNEATDQCQPDLKSTTSTATNKTTGQAICNSCGRPIMLACTSASMQRSGSGSTQQPREQGRVVGRWPSNVIHDGSEEVVGAFPETNSGGYPPEGGMRSQVHTYGKPNVRGEQVFTSSSGSAARFFYTAKADSDDRLGSKHPTVKPLDLMQYLVRLVTPPRGLVLDPFAGTGTTGEAAIREGMRAVLIEREEEYQHDIRRRMKLAMSGPDERSREAIKERTKDKPLDHGPLFGGRREDEARDT